MPTMRHPNVANAYEAISEDQASMLRMSGWVTEPEAPELFKAAAERERAAAEAPEESQDDESGEEPAESGEKKPKTPRHRSRATSDKESD
jgi:hypothetical protein